MENRQQLNMTQHTQSSFIPLYSTPNGSTAYREIQALLSMYPQQTGVGLQVLHLHPHAQPCQCQAAGSRSDAILMIPARYYDGLCFYSGTSQLMQFEYTVNTLHNFMKLNYTLVCCLNFKTPPCVMSGTTASQLVAN